MSEAITLRADEIEGITKKKRFSAQIRVLNAMRIPFKLRIDGSPCVFRAAANQHMGVAEFNNAAPKVKLNLDDL